MAVRNESDIIEQTLTHLVSQGITLAILDSSTDDSFEICRRIVGGAGRVVRQLTDSFQWKTVLRKLYEMALEMNPEWVLLTGADEFLESPYPNLALKDAIESEAEKGYNLIQFNNFEFWPTRDDDTSEKDVRKRMRYYSWQDDFQFRCWRVRPDIKMFAGHYPLFDNPGPVRVSPTKFVIRHYKIRSYEHGVRKVFDDRLPRFDGIERKEGWHVQYNNFKRDIEYFVKDSRSLTKYEEDGR